MHLIDSHSPRSDEWCTWEWEKSDNNAHKEHLEFSYRGIDHQGEVPTSFGEIPSLARLFSLSTIEVDHISLYKYLQGLSDYQSAWGRKRKLSSSFELLALTFAIPIQFEQVYG